MCLSFQHHDLAYMRKHYEVDFTDKYNAKRDDEESKKAFEFARNNWKVIEYPSRVAGEIADTSCDHS